MSSPNNAHRDDLLMDLALAQARLAVCLSPPNPAVGCVLVGSNGAVIGQGHTQRVGHAHAEVMALRDAAAGGHSTRGATAYVTLEPCSHTGRTPPCADALVTAGVSRVVAALPDPHPQVAGAGLQRLRAAGIQVDVGVGQASARDINKGFFSRIERGRPWVRLKVAASIDGITALDDGRSQWITGEAARRDTHRWRARAGAVVSGIGTVLADRARLNVRLNEADARQAWAGGAERQPLRVVVDSRLRIPLDAPVLEPAEQAWVATAALDPDKTAALQTRGVRVLSLPDAQQRVDLGALMRALAEADINEVHLEAGAHLNGAMLRAGCVDELLLYLAPKMLAAGRGLWTLPPLAALDQATAWRWVESVPVDTDLRLRAYHPDSDRFLAARSIPVMG